MIGSDFAFVKRGYHYEGHIVSGAWVLDMTNQRVKKEGKSLFGELRSWIKRLKNPEAPNLTPEEVIEIASATTCNEGSPGYHKFASDCRVLVDMDEKKVYHWSYGVKGAEAGWVEY
jgi:hypothetical protein